MNSKVKQRHAKGLFGPVEPEAPEIAAPPKLTIALAGARTLVVDPEQDGQRLDKFLAAASQAAGEALSRTRLQGLIEAGQVAIDGKPASDTGAKVRTGQSISVVVPEAIAAQPQGEAIPLDVVFEDAHLIIINKPAGLVVHPASGHESGTLVNALIAHCGETLSGIGGVRRPGIVHRLDKDTTGLMVVAKTDAAHQGFTLLFADHGRTLNLEREYLALVWGAPNRPRGTVNAALGRHPHQREKQAVVRSEQGREAITHWHVEETFKGESGAVIAALMRCALETGRTHQIRVHMAHIGHPVVADPVYAASHKTKAALLGVRARTAYEALGRQALHAAVLGFTHPVTGEDMRFEAPLPAGMLKLVEALRG